MRRPWPQIRAVLVALHVLAVLVLATPAPGTVAQRRAWRSRNFQLEMVNWSRRLGTTPEQLQTRLWRLAVAYATVREVVGRPFGRYAALVGAGQGWTMFASPQKHPAEVHVDVFEDGAWRPLVRPRSPELDWRLRQLEHNRFRKMLGRFARTFHRDRYDGLAAWLARQAFADFPGVTRVRVQLYRYRTLPPDRVRAGERPQGQYDHLRIFDREATP